ncbi:MAG: hypothetical protein AAF442_09345 [Pseudomonadota bacterium]
MSVVTTMRVRGGSILSRATSTIDKSLRRAAWSSGLLVEAKVKPITPVGVGGGGGLRGSIITSPPHKTQDGLAVEVGSALSYAVPVELGTKPHMPPVVAIQDWVRQKITRNPKLARAIAWRIAMKIRAKGTKGAHMFERGLEAAQAGIEKIFDGAGTEIITNLTRKQ